MYSQVKWGSLIPFLSLSFSVIKAFLHLSLLKANLKVVHVVHNLVIVGYGLSMLYLTVGSVIAFIPTHQPQRQKNSVLSDRGATE